MTKFDVFSIRAAKDILVVEIQSDLLTDLETTVAIPLIPEKLTGEHAI